MDKERGDRDRDPWREREKERETGTETERKTGTVKGTDGHKDRGIGTDTERERTQNVIRDFRHLPILTTLSLIHI